MKKEKFKKYLDKIKLFKKYNKLYYDKNVSKVTDEEFDNLKKDLINLEKQYHFLKSKDSPSINIDTNHLKILKNPYIKYLCYL